MPEPEPVKELTATLTWQTWLKSRTGRMTLLGGMALLAVIVASSVTYARYARERSGSNGDGKPVFSINFGDKKSDETKTAVSNLDGTTVPADQANRRPIAVMVENHPDARPQSGLSNASVVLEAIAEGGITRFMALLGSQNVEKIGPVRSARPYYVQFASGWKAIYAHAGGSEGGLAALATAPVVNLDNTNGYFHREPKPGLASEPAHRTSAGWGQGEGSGQAQRRGIAQC